MHVEDLQPGEPTEVALRRMQHAVDFKQAKDRREVIKQRNLQMVSSGR
jgi:hypothetical protein